MASIRQRYRKTLQSRDIALLDLYHLLPDYLEDGQGIFGPGYRLALANQTEDSPDGLYDLTLKNIAWHSGFAIGPKQREVLRDVDESFIKAVEERRVSQFYQRTLAPTRQYIESKLECSFYCMNNLRVVTNEKTGKPRIERDGPRVLMPIPHSSQVGNTLNIPENTIKLLAPIAIHSLQNELGRGSVRDAKELMRRLDSWFEYEPRLKRPFQEAMKVSNPCIASQKVVRQLLLAM